MWIKLSEYARKERVNYKTAYLWFREGSLAYPVRQLPTGRIMVDFPDESDTPSKTVVYARVSSQSQSAGLDSQVARVTQWAVQNGHSVDDVVTEVGSSLNGKRRKFLRLLSDASVGTIMVEHRDRFCRFGAEYIAAALAAQNRKLVVVDDSEVEDDLVRDVTEVLTSLCARLYGKRGAKSSRREGCGCCHQP